jgi:carboxymethylenebutenolidase
MVAAMKTTLFVLLSLAVSVSAQDWAKPRLEKSPRHLEWVTVSNGTRAVKCFIAYPEVKDKATAVVVIHEIFGLTDWVRGVTDQLAEAGYIVIAPDFLSGSTFESLDDARKAISTLPADQITGDLDAVTEYVAKLPACNGKVAVAGFCWGGSQSFRYATNNKSLKAAFVFYGTGPDSDDTIARIQCPVYGFYGGNDNRVNATIPQSAEQMKKAGKTYDAVTYDGAGHGFMRAGEDPKGNEANKKAREDGWKRWLGLLKKL